MRSGRHTLSVLGAAILAGGCARGVDWLDARDRTDPLMRRARAKQNEGDADGAVALYREALNADHRMARAHLDLALLLHQEQKDYLGAVCHYRRYLEMRPDAEKKPIVEKRMQVAMQLLVAGLMPDGGDAGAVSFKATAQRSDAELVRALRRVKEAEEMESAARERLAEVEAENRRLRLDARHLEHEIDQARAAVVIADGRAASVRQAPSEPERRETVARTYKVNRGDSLSSIAADVYGDAGRWRDILNANRDVLNRSPQIQVGQVLVIP